MSYCFNPDCPHPQNPDAATHCQQCGMALQLRNGYRAVKVLGQGGFGRTLLAIATPNVGDREPLISAPSISAPSTCVIKQFLPRPVNVDSQHRARTLFQQEAQRLAELGQHPQIPDFFEFFQEGERLYLVQEYIAGVTLTEQLATQGPFTETQIWQVLTELLPVLKFIHDRQVIHRDIKPENIIRPVANALDNNTPLVLVDFGSAKAVTPIAQVQPGTVIGSAEYVAPEQARGKAVFASDLYSLGVTCIHLLTGMSPFDLVDSGHNSWVWQQFLSTPVSPELSQILDRLIHPALDHRFPTADAVMQAMQPITLMQAGGDRSQEFIDRALPSDRLLSNQSLAPQSQFSCQCEFVLSGHTAAVNTVAISPDGTLIASGSQDKTIRFWHLETGQALQQHRQDAPILAIAFSGDGKHLAVASQDKLIRVYFVETFQESFTLAGHTQAIKTIAVHPQHPFLASGSSDKTIRIWQLQSGELVTTLSSHRLAVNALTFSPDGSWLASGGSDHKVCLWRVHSDDENLTFTPTKTLTDHVDSVLALAFSPDSQILATGGDDRTIKLWDVSRGQLQQTLSAHSWSVSALRFSPLYGDLAAHANPGNPCYLISGGWDALLKLWPIAPAGMPPEALSLSGHTDSIHAIAVGGMRSDLSFPIVSASRDRTLRIWRCTPTTTAKTN